MRSHQTYAFRKDDGTVERRTGAGYGKIWALCARCAGSGEEDRDGPKACSACGGRGEVDVGEDLESVPIRSANDDLAVLTETSGREIFCAACLRQKWTSSSCTFDSACAWESFWPLPDPLHADRAPELDATWLAARGIDPGAPLVLRCLRDEVLPLVRRMERAGTLAWYSFLVHGHASGVPTAPDDRRAFIHLRLVTRRGAAPQMPAGWLYTRQQPLSPQIAGVQTSALSTRSADAAWRLIGAQSEWVLALIEQHEGADVLDLLRNTRQFLHFFVNMTQMTAQ